MSRVRWILIFCNLSWILSVSAQDLFVEECFVGGVTAAGITGSLGPIDGKFQFHWEEDFELIRAFAFTYRYGRPVDNEIFLNGESISLDMSSQIGVELPDAPPIGQFAVHGIDITNSIDIVEDSISVVLDAFEGGEPINTGWWSVMCVFLYESPTIIEPVCLRIYTANQNQNASQNYYFPKPSFDPISDLGFAIYSDRINDFEEDRSLIGINGSSLGNIGGADNTNPGSAPFNSGVRGHFYYENGQLFGLDDDIPNNTVEDSDGIAVINEYLTDEAEQQVFLTAISYPTSFARGNPHPAFFLTYTPDCTVLPDLGEVPRRYSFCRGDTVQITTTDEYENFEWSKAAGLSDSTSANPLCFADSSGWYMVKMWNEAEPGCSQTIPIFIEVNDIPRPANFDLTSSFCPENSGEIRALNPAGNAPFTHWLDDEFQFSGVVQNLAPGEYDFRINSAVGCEWDTTVTIPLNPIQVADFTANPESGFSPLDVFFNNNSNQATAYQWLIDGVPTSESENLLYAFTDSGSYEITLIAFRNELTCADTATFILRVEPGIQVLMPNVISPNGDGRNDRLIAQIQGVASCRWTIFNRWGNEVALGEETNPVQEVEIWSPDSELAEGTYTLVLVARGLAGQIEQFEFQVAVVR